MTTRSSGVDGYIFINNSLMTFKKSRCRVSEGLKRRCGRSRGNKAVQVFRLYGDIRT